MNLANIDFTDGNLRSAKLIAANVHHCNFWAADLSGADLTNANLPGAEFWGTKLTGAKFCGANLERANFYYAFLTDTDFQEAELSFAQFNQAILHNADFSNSEMLGTIFGGIDLSTARGLETVRHTGPSEISITTTYRSNGKISEVFLRRAGLPAPFIANMKTLISAMEPVQFYSCFISYSSKDHDFVARLHSDLQSRGVRCWFAPEDLKIGDKLRPSFDEAIQVHDKLMVILTESSVKSTWVEKEVETAFEKERKEERIALFPIRLDDAVMDAKQAWAADVRRTRHIGPVLYPSSSAEVDPDFTLSGGGCEVGYNGHGSGHAEHMVRNEPVGTFTWICAGADPPNLSNPSTSRAYAIGIKIQ